MNHSDWSKPAKWAFPLAGVALVVVLAMVALLSVVKAADTATDAEFRVLIDRLAVAWSNMDPDQPAPFYAKDEGLVFYDVAPFSYHGWAEYREGVKKNLFDKMTSGKLTAGKDLTVTRRGKVAWTTVTLHFSATWKAGGSMEQDLRHTAIWEKRGGKWLIVHEHVSAPLPES